MNFFQVCSSSANNSKTFFSSISLSIVIHTTQNKCRWWKKKLNSKNDRKISLNIKFKIYDFYEKIFTNHRKIKTPSIAIRTGIQNCKKCWIIFGDPEDSAIFLSIFTFCTVIANRVKNRFESFKKPNKFERFWMKKTPFSLHLFFSPRRWFLHVYGVKRFLLLTVKNRMGFFSEDCEGKMP